jgi:hypothetical protein
MRWLNTTRVERLGYRPADARHDFAPPRKMLVELLRALDKPTLAASKGIEPLLGRPFDQGSTGSCTYESAAKALRVSVQRNGGVMPWEDFSPKFGYGITRSLEREATRTPGSSLIADLEDGGAVPDDVITATELYGVKGIGPLAPDGRYCDITPENVNDEADLEDSELAALHLTTGAHDINVVASDLEAQLVALPQRAIGGCLALFVDTQNFMGWDPNRGPIQKIDLRDPKGGGHQVCGPTSTYLSPTFGTIIRFLNSWGEGWGISGYGEITFAALRAALDAALAFDSRWT